ncbi:MAG: glycosyltransferase [Verrucomicrobiota bacterium]|nr:glycosyltransferase [Verrucomicrobiota bacterium]
MSTSTTHLLRGMARDVPVLWIESIGTRTPQLGSGRDLARVFRRLRNAWLGPRRMENRLWVLAPLLVPRAEGPQALAWNRRVLARAARRWAAGVGGCAVEYWCFVPNAADLLPAGAGRGGAAAPARPFVVYCCVDDWGRFENLDGAWLEEKERALLECADVVFAASRVLERKCRAVAGERVHYLPHGVDHARFAVALDSSTAIPPELAALPRPIAGFYGNLSPWVDFGLLESLAGRLPGWSFALIGPVYTDVSRLSALPNVRLLGRRAYEALPALCKSFDVGMIPYDMRHPRMPSVNPVKTLELLAAGVPVAAARIPELERGFGGDVALCDGVDEWRAALERQAGRRDRAAISARVKEQDWSARVRTMREIVEKKKLGN